MNKKQDRQIFTLAGRSVLSTFISGSLAESTEVSENQQNVAAEPSGDIRWLPVGDIRPGACQPRQFFSEEGIEALAKSFREQGFRGAINVRPREDGTWDLIAGERRWRAAQRAGLTQVRCIIDHYTDQEALEFGLIENLQREDLSKLEETEGILKLIEVKLGISKERAIAIIRTEGHPDRTARNDVAPSDQLKEILAVLASFGVELQTFRTKNLRTISLPEDIKKAHLEQGLSYSAALELLKIKDAWKRQALLKEAIKVKLSLRDIRSQVKAAIGEKDSHQTQQREGDTVLIRRLKGISRRLKAGINMSARSPKRKQLENLLGELEKLLGGTEVA